MNLSTTNEENIKTLLHKLPNEIIEIIRRLTYKLQSPILLNDISNFINSKTFALCLYKNLFIIEFRDNNTADYDWFLNDICIYYNDDCPTNRGFVDKHINLLNRNFMTPSKKQAIKYTHSIYKKSVYSQINILWGLLKPDERSEMLNITDFLENETN